ncbi:MAG TPA: NADH-quinone oxidoreductase subunit N, partial [Anaerolineae bacterium]|nr:NADH-quinone oxidoreductase subunit N [Anaerolineae bacterium]
MNDLLLLLPEIIITFVAFALLTLDIVWKGDQRSTTILPWLAVAGAIGALAATMNIWWGGAASATYGIATDAGDFVPMLAVDSMALFFKMLSALTILLVGLSAVDYINLRTPFRGEFYVLTLLAGLSLMLLSSATNLVMIYLSLEFLSITSYVLTGYLRQDSRSTEAALKYFLYGAVASGVMLYGFSLLYGLTGSVDLATIASTLAASPTSPLLVVGTVIMILTGFGFKIALVPFHQWSPDAYEGAPTPVTAFLSVGPKAAGMAVLIRVLTVALPEYSVNWTVILSIIAILTMTVGNLVALWQTNMKRLLAYSSIAQAGYMLIGLAAWTSQGGERFDGVNGILLYLFAYLFTNLGLFTVAIILENKMGTANIADYAGLMRRSPFLSIALLIFFLSLIGIPPTGGFMGKLFVFGAAIDQSLYLLAAVGILNSVISVYYYFGITRQVFFTPGPDESPIQPGWVMGGVV